MADVDVDVDVEVHDAPDFQEVPDGQDVKDTSTAPPPAPNPDAQTTVNDFLDYTDFYPSDLVRSLTLIGELDARCADAVQHMHDLTALYCQLPQLPEPDRPDAARLRAQIARHLHTAIAQRAYASNEADRLYELTTRHCQRASIIRRKLQAQPEPPSRDPTPPPVSPTALRRTYERPRLHLALDHHTNNTNNHHRKSAVPVPRGRPRARSTSSSPVSDSLDPVDHHHHHTHRPRKRHSYKDRPPKPRSRAPGVAGTNVHSSIAGISTSNALAKLTPPPADARPGSKWAPWMKLTEYEMAVLRKQMKKNAVWTPSLTMVNRELERKHRTRAHYDREKARCEAAGESLLDEEPETLLQIATAQGVDDPALTATANAADGLTAPGDPATTTINNTTTTATGPPRDDESVDGHTDRDTRRQKARGALRALEDATKTIQNAADGLKELTFSAVATPPARRKSTARPTTAKRKRDTSTAESTRDPEAADKDTSSTLAPEPKRPRLQLIAPAPPPEQTPSTPAPRSAATPAPSAATPAPRSTTTPARKDPPSPVSHTPVPLLEPSPTTIQIPLAPAGPSTPKAEHSASARSSRPPTPAEHSPTSPKRSSPVVPVHASDEPPAQLSITAASTRAGRKSITPKNSSPPPAEPSKPRPASTEPAIALRPRSSRSHVPTPKAQSEEPKPNEGRPVRDARRHSIFSQSALTAPAPTRASARRKPPPKGEITSAEHGQKTVTNVKRSQGSKNNKKKPNGVVGGEGKPGHFEEEVDSDEERYCICDDVSYGQMISCDNNCDKEWFHFECVGMTQMPARRAKWYCPDCRKKLGTDAFGNPLVPPALPGRGRGNRGWST